MHFRSLRLRIFTGWLVVLALLIMASYMFRDGRPLPPQSFEGLETDMRISGKQTEVSAQLLKAVHYTAQNLGIGSTPVTRKVEGVLADRLRVREMERIDAQAELIRLKTLTEVKAGMVPKNDSRGTGRKM